MPCRLNEDCQKSSWCCSGGKCVPGSTCYQGSKLIDDFCDYGFECLSRCCPAGNKKCSSFMYCAEQCETNSDCAMDCCSFGYCSSANVCFGRKVDGDNCGADSECASQICSVGVNGQDSDAVEANQESGSTFGVLTPDGTI